MTKVIRQLISTATEKGTAIVVILTLVVVLSGVLYSLDLGKDFRWIDETAYYTVASNLVSKHQFTLNGEQSTAWRAPGYPFILSLGITLGAGIVHLRILNFLAYGLNMYLLYRILTKESSRLAGTIGVILIVCYPVLFYISGTLLPVTIASSMFLLGLFLLSRGTDSHWDFLLAGLLFGYLILTVPNFIFAVFVVVIWSWLSKGPKRIQGVTIIIVAALFVVGLWTIRNYRVFNSFVLVSSNSGLNLLLANSENYANTPPNAGSHTDISRYEYEAVAAHLDEIETDAYYRSKAIEFILENKPQAAKLYLLRVVNYFNYANNVAANPEQAGWKDLIMLFTYGPLLLLFVVRLIFARRIPLAAIECLFVSLYLSNAFVQAVFLTRIRYRLPFDFLLIIVVAMFLEKFFMGRFVKPGSSLQNFLQHDR